MVSTADMIDYMLVRWGESESADRAKCLEWLQASEQELWTLGPWHWREEELDYTLTAGQNTYSCDSDTANVLDLILQTGPPLRRIPYRTFLKHYRATVSGTPTRWSMEPQDATIGVIRFTVWPTPSDNTSLRMRREIYAGTLQDHASNGKSRFPVDDRIVVANNALHLMALHEGKNDMAALYGKLKDTGIQAMLARSNEKVQGYR